jgi:predicted ArsR family transcriptional regulator
MLKLNTESTKSRVLHVLRGHGGTAQDVADALDLSIPAARRHLMDLEADGLLESRVHRPGGRGRPQHVFRVSDKGEAHFPKAYAELCTDILQHLDALYGSGALLNVLTARNRTLLERWQHRVQGDLETRVFALCALLNELDCHVSVTREGEAWLLFQGNCPSLEVSKQFEALCHSECALYASLLQADVTREARVLEGASACRYRIRAREATST